MRKLSLIIAFVSMLTICKAQKLRKPDIDKITGDTTLLTYSEKIGSAGSFWGVDYLYVDLGKYKGYYFLDFKMIKSDAKAIVFSIDKDNHAILKLADNTVLTIQSVSDVISDSKVSTYGSITTSSSQAEATYMLNEESLNALKKTQVSIIRIETSKGNFDYEIKERYAGMIQKMIQLIDSVK